MKLYIRLLKYLKPYWLYLLGALLCMLILAGCNVIIIPLVGRLSEAIGNKNFGNLNLIVLAGISVYFLRGIFTYGQIYLMAFASQKVVLDLRVKIYKHLQDLSLDFFSSWKTGEVMSRVINDIGSIQTAFVQSATDILPHTLTLIGVLGYLFYLNWRLTALTLILTPIFIIAILKFGKEIRNIGRQVQKKAADITSILQETITGMRIVKSFTMEKQEIKRFKKVSEDSFWLSMVESSINATQQPLMGFLQVLAILAVVWYGGLEVISGRLTAGNLIAFFTGTALLIDPIIVLSRVHLTVSRALASAERVFEVIDIQPSVAEIPHPFEYTQMKGNVEFRQVSFAYEEGAAKALAQIDLTVKEGEIIALVGPSGAGKSTFINLIPRFYDPLQGEIFVDGQNIKTASLFSLRKHMGIVPQETILFSGTIRENIAYGKTDASEAEIINAAKIANAHDFICSLPQKYASLSGEHGLKLSGGQRQRIAIARAILRNPKILILDEATSSLDTESEHLVQEAMEKLMKNRTTFVIAHRLSTIHHADRIVVLNQGRIAEIGTHQELLLKGGLYKRLYEMQFKNNEKTSLSV